MTEKNETEERLARPLLRLAKLVGIATSYVGQTEDYHEIDDDVLVAVLAALGIDASSDASIEQETHAILDRRHLRLIAPTVLHTAGGESKVAVNIGIIDYPTATITLENGESYDGAPLRVEAGESTSVYAAKDGFLGTALVIIPADLPMGYHTLHVRAGDRTADATLISAPGAITMPEAMQQSQQWGWMAQLYAIRSADSWGVGDYADLQALLTNAKAKTTADFVLVNPLHAGEPVSPLTPSPYLPISRSLVNFTYIRPESIEEYHLLDEKAMKTIRDLHEQAEPLNGDSQIIDRDVMWRLKIQALWVIFKAGRSVARRQRFEGFKQDMGDELNSYATWCLCYDKWGAPNTQPDNWVTVLDKDSAEVQALVARFPDTFDFYHWLEWIAVQQLQEAQRAAKESGMGIGIMADMAVGVHALGSDVWWSPENFAKGATVGAPPDYFNQQGQNWSQPPLNPLQLEQTGYRVYRNLVHGMFAQAGAVRIDHILGLFRLWWIPEGNQPVDGAYVHYDSETLLGILAIEATRAHGVVIGEDLGVVPQYVVESLKRHGILGCAVEWFEQGDGVFHKPSTWRTYALASVNTHDLPPAAGYLAYEQVKIREQLNLLTCPAEEFKAEALKEHQAMMKMLVDNGFLDGQLLDDEPAHIQQIVEALYKALKAAPSKLLGVSIADAVGETRSENQPGTDNEYPNWRIPLADDKGNVVPLEELFDNPRLRSLAVIMRGDPVHEREGSDDSAK